MADFIPDITAPAGEVPGGQPEPPKGPFSSPTARIVIIVGAVVGLLVILGLVVGAILLFNGARQAAQQVVTTPPSTPAVVTTRTTEPTVTIEGKREVIEVSNKDVFTARDPFEPLLKPLPQVTASESVSATGTLVLENIVTSNDVLTAILRWNGMTYTVVAGQEIKDSPWKALEITKSTVTMLYGDVQITLSIGEGVAQ